MQLQRNRNGLQLQGCATKRNDDAENVRDCEKYGGRNNHESGHNRDDDLGVINHSYGAVKRG